MGIAASVLEAVGKELERYPGRRALKVGVNVGEFAGVDTESLRFCFEVISKTSSLSPIDLDLIWCRAENGRTGEELDLAYLELEDDVIEVPA
ncbi:MAG TPA: hydrogenase/urease maturation nickel metallochaperone HypA [Bryobacteraceae bacterium]|nr:hydrogenase/urease maturation nickel metallochaperone HypA [Bryobacteraceae bacterium]